MVNVSDLRKGNYFQVEDIGPMAIVDFSCDFTGKLHQVQFLAELMFYRDRIPDRTIKTVIPMLTDIHPIALTPAILEKCGFEFTHVNTHFWRHHRCPEIELHGIKGWGKDVSGPYLFLSAGMPIANLHQLQNLYFAHRGEELNCQL